MENYSYELENEISEGILIYAIDRASLESMLIYKNDTAIKMLECSLGDFENCFMKINGLFSTENDDGSEIILKALENGRYIEERTLKYKDNETNSFRISLNVFQKGETEYIQVSMGEIEEEQIVTEKYSIDKLIEKIAFSKCSLGIIYLKNHDSIQKIYGEKLYGAVIKILISEVETVFGELAEIIHSDEVCFQIFPNEIDHIEEKYTKVIKNIKNKIKENEIDILCVLKAGISSYNDSKYIALHEAKFCVNEIMNRQKEVLKYIPPYEKSYIDFLIRSDLAYAIEKNELNVYFQGIFNTDTFDLYAFEVLLRWNHSKYGVISPNDFVPIAEESNLITRLDLWAFENAVQKYIEITKEIKKNVKLNINISPRDFFDETFLDDFINIIETYKIDPENIILEMTETLNMYPKRNSIERIKNLGVLIALDDFGTGFASLSQLKNYRIDILKIDMSFIKDINKDYNNTLITKAILSMANSLSIDVIAEGVETSEQIDFLRKWSCSFIQGFKVHKPIGFRGLVDEIEKHAFEVNEVKIMKDQIEKKEYVQTYTYGKYIYTQLNEKGQFKILDERLDKSLNRKVEIDDYFVDFVSDDYQDIFRKNLSEIIKNQGEISFVSFLKSNSVDIPSIITLDYEMNTQNIDLYVEMLDEKKYQLEQIRNKYNRYDLIFDEVGVAIIIVNNDLEIIEWNKGAERTFGYNKKEVMKKDLIQLLVKPDISNEIGQIAEKTLQKENTTGVNENITKNGEVVLCEWENSPIFSDIGEVVGIMSIVKDITVDNIIREELNLVSTVVKQDPSAIIVTDLDGTIEFVNNSFLELTQYTMVEIIGQKPSILSSGEQSQEFYKTLWNTIVTGNTWNGEFRNVRKDNSTYIADTTIFPIKNNKGDITKFAGIQKDISEEVDKDYYLKEISNTLENQERLSLVGQMAAGIMHEINNPLSFIDINVHALKDMLNEIKPDCSNDEIMEELLELASDLKDGIDNIKSIAAGLKRYTYKSQSNEFEMISLNDEIDTIITVSKNEYKYYADIRFQKDEVVEIYGDSGKIRQVLLNLIINAVHAIRGAEKSEFGIINIRTFGDENNVYCTIEDNGSGIKVENYDKIFKIFFTTKGEGKGTGLGLSLSKKIIEEEHKGQIYFDSKVGEGTVFTLKFPRNLG